MGNGMKITLVILLFVVVAAVVKLLDKDIQEAPDGSSDVSKSEISSPGKSASKDAEKKSPSEGDRDNPVVLPAGDFPRDGEPASGSDEGLRPVSSEDTGAGGRADSGELVHAAFDVPGDDPSGEIPLDAAASDQEALNRLFAEVAARDLPEAGSTGGGSDDPSVDWPADPTVDPTVDPTGVPAVDPTVVPARVPNYGQPNGGRVDEPPLDPSSTAESGGTSVDDSDSSGSGFPRKYTVVEGDTLWDIAAAVYGSGVHLKEILVANPKLGDGSRVRSGLEIVLPRVAKANGVSKASGATKKTEGASNTSTPEPSRLPNGQRTYEVKKNDNLYRIAAKMLGNGTRWPEIVDVNPGIDPNRLSVGQRLVIPRR